LFSLPKLPNLILFPVSVKPLPIIVMLVPFGPALGLKLSIIGTIRFIGTVEMGIRFGILAAFTEGKNAIVTEATKTTSNALKIMFFIFIVYVYMAFGGNTDN